MSKLRGHWLFGLLSVVASSVGCAADGVGGAAEALGEADAGVEDATEAPATVVTVDELLERGTVIWEVTHGVFRESPFELIEGEVIVEGDISLGTLEEALEEDRLAGGRARAKGVLNTRNTAKWDDGRIRYMVAGDMRCSLSGRRIVGPPGRCTAIQRAVDGWNAQRFETGLEWQYDAGLRATQHGVRFTPISGSRSSSRFGRKRGRQQIRVGSSASANTVMHEMGHAMGMWHEHMMDGRDRYVSVREEFTDGAKPQFDFRELRGIRRTETIGAYDENSMMHYPSSLFAAGSVDPTLYDPTLPLVSRLRLALWEYSVANQRIDGEDDEYNPRATLRHLGIRLEDVVVRDVDQDGADDLVTSTDGGMVWSMRGATGWFRLLTPSGDQVPTVRDLHTGEYDHHAGRDVLVLDSAGRVITLYSSDGTTQNRRLTYATQNLAAGNVDAQGPLDVVVAQRVIRARGPAEVEFLLIPGGELATSEPSRFGANWTGGPSPNAWRLVETEQGRWCLVATDPATSELLYLPMGSTWRATGSYWPCNRSRPPLLSEGADATQLA